MYCRNTYEPHLPKSWIRQTSIWLAARCTAPDALAEWPVKLLAPFGCDVGKPSAARKCWNVSAHPVFEAGLPTLEGKTGLLGSAAGAHSQEHE